MEFTPRIPPAYNEGVGTRVVTEARLLSVQVNQTPGLYVGPSVYPGPGFYQKFYGRSTHFDSIFPAHHNLLNNFT